METPTFIFTTEFTTKAGDTFSGYIYFDEHEVKVVDDPSKASKKTFFASENGIEQAEGLGMYCASLIDLVHGHFDVQEESFSVDPVSMDTPEFWDWSPRMHGQQVFPANYANRMDRTYTKVQSVGDVALVFIHHPNHAPRTVRIFFESWEDAKTEAEGLMNRFHENPELCEQGRM